MFLFVLLLFFCPFSQVRASREYNAFEESDSDKIGVLNLCQIWGILKYFQSEIINHNVYWDDKFGVVIDKVNESIFVKVSVNSMTIRTIHNLVILKSLRSGAEYITVKPTLLGKIKLIPLVLVMHPVIYRFFRLETLIF